MEEMEFESKYIDIVKAHKLNGSALVFGDAEDLKALLHMTFGEWANFKLHFLSFNSTLRPQYVNMWQFPYKNHLSKSLHHVQHHYSSTLSVLTAESCNLPPL